MHSTLIRSNALCDELKGSLEQLSSYVQMNDDEARNEVAEIQKSLRKGAYGDSEFLEKWCPILNEDKGLANFHLKDTYKINVQSPVTLFSNNFSRKSFTILFMAVGWYRVVWRTSALITRQSVSKFYNYRLGFNTKTHLM